MKVRSIILGEAVRVLNQPAFEGTQLKLFGIHLIRAIQDRYGFLVVPRELEEFDLLKGIKFARGYFEGAYSIDELVIFNNGIRAVSRQGTEVADRVIDDLLEFLAGEASDGTALFAPGARIYSSTLEAHFVGDFAERFERYNQLAAFMSASVVSYGGPSAPFEPMGLIFWTNLQNQGPSPFRFERRVDTPFSENVFFSSAPLATPDHQKALELLERLTASPPAS